MGDYPTSASDADADDSEGVNAAGSVGLGRGRRNHPRGRQRRSDEMLAGIEELRDEKGRKGSVDHVRGSRGRDDPVRDVLSKFLDIYQDDQEKMKKQLDDLAAEPPLSSSSSGVRFRGSSLDRQQQTRFTDINQAPPPPPSTTSSALKGGKGLSKGSSSSSSPSARRPLSNSHTTSSSPPRPPWRTNRSPERAGDRGDNNRKGQYPGDSLEMKNDRESEKIRLVASSGYAHGAAGVGVNNHVLRQEEEELVSSLFHTRWASSNNKNDHGGRMDANTAAQDQPVPLFPCAPSPAPTVSGLGRTLSSKKLNRSSGVTKKQK